jgi:hypothetical protein
MGCRLGIYPKTFKYLQLLPGLVLAGTNRRALLVSSLLWLGGACFQNRPDVSLDCVFPPAQSLKTRL